MQSLQRMSTSTSTTPQKEGVTASYQGQTSLRDFFFPVAIDGVNLDLGEDYRSIDPEIVQSCLSSIKPDNIVSDLNNEYLESFEKSISHFQDLETRRSIDPSNVNQVNLFQQTMNDPKLELRSPSSLNNLSRKIKPFQQEKWLMRYQELVQFHKENGHVGVPLVHPKNPQLFSWVKRQRREYKRLIEGKPSTMTAERKELLERVGFIWDLHDFCWKEKLDALREYRSVFGHCNVPFNYEDKKLSIWVKDQRRHYGLYKKGKRSKITPKRIAHLRDLGFEWGH